MGGKDNKVANSKPATTADEGGKREGARLHQTHTTINGRKGQDQIYALYSRNPHLARRGKLTNPLPHIKVSSKMIWTFPHQASPIRRFIRAGTTAPMEDTSGDPRESPDTL